ncbi:hypothetical protein ACJX0J_012402, partial [Zea mays]
VGPRPFRPTCLARPCKGDMRGQVMAVNVISKAKMTTAISIEDVRKEVKILKALSGHSNLVKFYDACEDALNVYIIMEGGRYNEGDAKIIVEQILKVVAFCHLQGVVHRDLKPENFLFSTREEHSPMKIIDFGLSDFIRPDERLNDIVGSAYYVAPEVLHRSYSTEADMWRIGVITYILMCGSRPFWARTESRIFRSVLRADPNFDDSPWQSVSPEAKDFVKRLLNKDYRKRMTWLHNEHVLVTVSESCELLICPFSFLCGLCYVILEKVCLDCFVSILRFCLDKGDGIQILRIYSTAYYIKFDGLSPTSFNQFL